MNSDEQTDPEVPSLSFKEENYHYLDILTFTSIYHVFIWDIKSIYPVLVNDVLFASGLLLQFLLPLSVQINYHKDKPIFCGRIGKETSAINTEKKNAFVSGKKKNGFFGDGKKSSWILYSLRIIQKMSSWIPDIQQMF